MILTDTGPIVALLDSDDPYHSQCLAASQRLPGEPFLTTWPCFTEAMYLLGLAGGHRYRVALWDLYRAGNLVLHNPTPGETGRMAQQPRVCRGAKYLPWTGISTSTGLTTVPLWKSCRNRLRSQGYYWAT
jgi:hypothetical protein